jgi:endonuclease YncB( thermonuclease family)
MLARLVTRLIAVVTFRQRVDPLIGRAKVLDGDTIIVAGECVRLHGIDALELDQPFWWRGQQMAGGMMALAALEALTAGVNLRCEAVERDRHGRLVAKVFSPNGVDISRRLVSAGWAMAYRQYSTDYVDAEDEARKARRGMWKGSFVKPWMWRASSRAQLPHVPTLASSGGRRPVA